jgi:hypothetical protein
MRCGEALSLQWSNVDLERGVAFLPKMKSGRSRQVILNELASMLLRELPEKRVGDNPFVFPGRKPGAHMAEPRRTFEKVKRAAKLGNLRVHDLRHTFASIAVQNGASLYEVQKLLGHSSSVMTQRYSHLSDDGLRAVTNGVASQIAAVGQRSLSLTPPLRDALRRIQERVLEVVSEGLRDLRRARRTDALHFGMIRDVARQTLGVASHLRLDMIDLKLLAIVGMGFPMAGQRHVLPFHCEQVARERTGPSVLIA